MAQIIDEYRGLGDALGKSIGQGLSGFGEGFGGSLQRLADMKISNLIKRHESAENQKILEEIGVDPSFSKFVLSQPEKQRGEIVHNYLNRKRQEEAQGMEALQQLSPNNTQNAQQQNTAALGNLFNQGAIGGGINQQYLQNLLRNPAAQQQLAQAQQQGQPGSQLAPQQEQAAAQQSPVEQAPKRTKASLYAEALKPAAIRIAEKKEALEERKIGQKERAERFKETKKYVDTLKDQEKAAKESDLRLNRMVKLIEKGKLPNAGLWSFLTKVEEAGPLASGAAGALLGHVVPGIGHVVGGLAGALSSPLAGAAKSFIRAGSPDVEEFEKLSADFVKNAKQFFGPRLTDADLRVFMQTLPTLMQTDAGKKKVIENLSSLNELSQIESRAARSIIRENGGIPPLDIEQQVKDKISDEIDRVAKRFIGL